MQTALRINQGEPGGTHYPIGRPVRHPKRNIGTKKEDTAATGKRHDFLTDKIPPLAPDFWHKDGYDGSPVNLTTPENFDYLYQSASNYAGLMGIKKVSEKAAFFFCYAARLLSIFIFKISLVFSIITFREVILQK